MRLKDLVPPLRRLHRCALLCRAGSRDSAPTLALRIGGFEFSVQTTAAMHLCAGHSPAERCRPTGRAACSTPTTQARPCARIWRPSADGRVCGGGAAFWRNFGWYLEPDLVGIVIEHRLNDVAFPPTKVWFAADSPLEGTGFEPSVPLRRKALLGIANRRRLARLVEPPTG